MQNLKEKELEIKEKYRSRAISIHGVKRGYLSPYDVPRKAKAVYNDTEKLFSIEFDYLTPNEPKDVKSSGDGITKLHIGRISGKLYSVDIRCPSKKNLPQLVSIQVTSELDKLIANSENNPTRLVEHENLSTTKEFLTEEPDLKKFMQELAVK